MSAPSDDLTAARKIVAVTAMDLRWAAKSTRAALELAGIRLGITARRARALYHGEARRVTIDELAELRAAFDRHLVLQDRAWSARQQRLAGSDVLRVRECSRQR